VRDIAFFVHEILKRFTKPVGVSLLAPTMDSPQRDTILAIQQVIMLAELAVNRVLDNHEIPANN
jgi:hypothetical protein